MNFERLFTPHIETLYRISYRWTEEVESAEDLVQDLALKLIQKTDELATLDNPLPWMVKVMYRMFIDRYRRKVNSPVIDSGPLDPSENIESLEAHRLDSPEVVHFNKQLKRKLNQAISELDQDQKVAFLLFEIEGFKLTDIADIQQVSLGTVKSRIYRAKCHLKERLAGEPFCPEKRDKEQRT